MDDLLTKLHNLEGPWKATLCSGSQYNSCNNPVPLPLMSSATYSAPTQLMTSAADIPQDETLLPHLDSKTSSKFGLAANYNPTNVSYINKDGCCVQTYKLPNSQQTITLGRPCRSCSHDHFDFEHDFLSQQLKVEAHIFQAKLELTQAYGHTTICQEPFSVDHDKYISSLDTSFGSSSSKNRHMKSSIFS